VALADACAVPATPSGTSKAIAQNSNATARECPLREGMY
jgi:hypothetical protein